MGGNRRTNSVSVGGRRREPLGDGGTLQRVMVSTNRKRRSHLGNGLHLELVPLGKKPSGTFVSHNGYNLKRANKG